MARCARAAATAESTPPRKAADGPAVAHLIPDRDDLGVDYRVHRPARSCAAAAPQETLQHLATVRRVLNFGMELHRVEAPLSVLEGGHRRGRGYRGDGRARGRIDDGVGMAHPHRLGRGQIREQDPAAAHSGQLGPAVLAALVGADRAAELLGDELGAVADAQHGHAEVVDPGVEAGRPLHMHRGRATAEDHAGGPAGRDLCRGDRRGHDLAIYLAFAHPPGDELCVLSAEVDDEDGVEGAVSGGAQAGIAAKTRHNCRRAR